jgi:hypothetical protein
MEEREERKQEEARPVDADGDRECLRALAGLVSGIFVWLALASSHTLA